MSDTAPLRETTALTLPLRVADLPNRQGVDFRLAPEASARADLAARLEVPKIRKLLFTGKLRPDGHHDWQLDGMLGATVEQSCVVTSEPVTTRIDTGVRRRFLRRMEDVTELEYEIPEDDSIEPLGPVIDLGEVMAEALTLALPDYPRAPGAEFAGGTESRDDPGDPSPGKDPDRQTPFADLSAMLKNKSAD